MKKLVWFVMVVGLFVCSGSILHAGNIPNPIVVPVIVTNPTSKPVPVQSLCCYRFVGFTTGTTNGAAGGYQGMNQKCQAEFTPTSRICTASEMKASIVKGNPPGIHSNAWILPGQVQAFLTPPNWIIGCVSGVALLDMEFGNVVCFDQSLDCQTYSITNQVLSGLVYTTAPTSHTLPRPCDEVNNVACCDVH